MRSRVRQFAGFAVVAGLALAPIAAQLALAARHGSIIAGGIVALQAGVLAWLFLGQAVAGRRWSPTWQSFVRVIFAVSVLAATFGVWVWAADGPSLASAIPHALVHIGLLVMFVASLAPGQTPLIEIVASRARGQLTPVLREYTRNVTIAWCVFFALQLAVSVLLGLWAPVSWWRAYLDFGTLPLVGLMFAGEMIYRHIRHGIFRPAGSAGVLGHARHLVGQVRAPLNRTEP
jgi:uncharacterized membrane protein